MFNRKKSILIFSCTENNFCVKDTFSTFSSCARVEKYSIQTVRFRFLILGTKSGWHLWYYDFMYKYFLFIVLFVILQHESVCNWIKRTVVHPSTSHERRKQHYKGLYIFLQNYVLKRKKVKIQAKVKTLLINIAGSLVQS